MSARGLILAALVFLILAGGGTAVYMTSKARGIRNNNPGNIRHGSRWQGMASQQTDAAFVQFTTPEYGIRALAKVLLTYQTKYGLNTIRGIITRWAPPTENNTAAYIDSVSRYVGASPDAPLDLHRASVMRPLVEAIIRHENGVQPYTVAQINSGLRLAGVVV